MIPILLKFMFIFLFLSFIKVNHFKLEWPKGELILSESSSKGFIKALFLNPKVLIQIETYRMRTDWSLGS